MAGERCGSALSGTVLGHLMMLTGIKSRGRPRRHPIPRAAVAGAARCTVPAAFAMIGIQSCPKLVNSCRE